MILGHDAHGSVDLSIPDETATARSSPVGPCIDAEAVGCYGVLGAPAAAQFWFGGVDPVVRKDRRVGEPADFMDLFKPDAPCSDSASRLSVFHDLDPVRNTRQ